MFDLSPRSGFPHAVVDPKMLPVIIIEGYSPVSTSSRGFQALYLVEDIKPDLQFSLEVQTSRIPF